MQDGTGMHVIKNQMYVEELVPAGGPMQRYPIIFVHGQAQTGTVCVLRARLVTAACSDALLPELAEHSGRAKRLGFMVHPARLHCLSARSASTGSIGIHARRRHTGYLFSRVHLQTFHWC